MNRDGNRHSLWQDTTTDFSGTQQSLAKEKVFDVILAGAGITGITTGLLLQKAGKSVLIAEAKNIGFGTSGGTTAHLNTFMDTSYDIVQNKFGKDKARLLALAIKNALQLIRQNVQEYQIDCGYRQLSAYLFSQDEKQSKELDAILKASKECDVACDYSATLPMPLSFEKVVEFPGQAAFHPMRYLASLANAFEEAGGVIRENCRITAVEENNEQYTVQTSAGEFLSSNFIYATHIPPGVNLLHFRCALYRSYAMAVKLAEQSIPDVLVYDMYDPYHYYRFQKIDGENYFIAGGEDHKTGHEPNTSQCFRKLEAHIRKHFPVKEVTNTWSSQYFEPTDGIPYIGHLPGHPGSMYVATGYGGNGMVYSAVAALTLTDLIVNGESDYTTLFDPNRISVVAGFSNFVKEAADVIGILGGKIFMQSDKLKELAELALGEASVIKYEGKKVAIYKDEKGEIFALHAACTHIKCDVAWNDSEKTWDCPCHGSRFSYTGEMLTAPARKDLPKIELEK